MARFAVSAGPWISEATQQRTLALRLVNRGGTACVLDGYPRLTLYGTAGVIPFPVSHSGDQMISAGRPRAVTVRRHAAVFVVMNKSQCVRGATSSTQVTTRIEIRAPVGSNEQSASMRFGAKTPFPWRIPTYCGKGDPGSTLTVSPFVPAVRAALAG
ncbi:MAG TPA: DUF4232 domain-containing protein [Vicinamibacterales bacterium]|nr:DUF4232 domain-containing protein [Vicinamibacterales bacterium]